MRSKLLCIVAVPLAAVAVPGFKFCRPLMVKKKLRRNHKIGYKDAPAMIVVTAVANSNGGVVGGCGALLVVSISVFVMIMMMTMMMLLLFLMCYST